MADEVHWQSIQTQLQIRPGTIQLSKPEKEQVRSRKKNYSHVTFFNDLKFMD